MTRSFLFLQGPVGPFFKSIGDALALEGHDVHRVNLWAGDVVDWPGADEYRGSADAWASWIAQYATARAVTDMVLFGDCRRMHEQAIKVLRPLGIALHVFEEGYFRPDWITMEEGGANGKTDLPRTARLYREAAGELPLPNGEENGVEHVGPWMSEAIPTVLRHHTAGWLRRSRFPGYEPHRPLSVPLEALSWVRRYIDKTLFGARRAETETALIQSLPPNYFVLPLQLESDAQIRRHSGFKSMRQVMETVMASFAASAPKESVIVVKIHPLDYANATRRTEFAELVTLYGLQGRAHLVEEIANPALLSKAAGVVTVNSSFGLMALERGVPVKTLGSCFWSMDQLTDTRSLDDFWKTPAEPDEETFAAFKAVVMHRTQINGGFYSARGRGLALPQVVARLVGRAELSDAEEVFDLTG